MKIIQSFWTKPYSDIRQSDHIRNDKGGWPHRKYHYLSWILSCMRLTNYYTNVELVTDSLGAELLIEYLKLPYSSVDCSMDHFNDYNTELWALGKIYAYSRQNAPFLHVDGDVFIWDKFPEVLITSPLICQHIESDRRIYNRLLGRIQETFDYVPKVFQKLDAQNEQILAINAGILGGTCIDFIQEYCREAKLVISENVKVIQQFNDGDYHLFNCIYEQCLFLQMAKSLSVPITPFFDKISDYENATKYFYDVPNRSTYVHSWGLTKSDPRMYKFLEHTVMKEYPSHYNNLINLIKTDSI